MNDKNNSGYITSRKAHRRFSGKAHFLFSGCIKCLGTRGALESTGLRRLRRSDAAPLPQTVLAGINWCLRRSDAISFSPQDLQTIL